MNTEQVKKPYKRFENKQESINDMIERSGKSRDEIMVSLFLSSPKIHLIREPRNTREEIKRAKRNSLLSVNNNEVMLAFSNAKTPNWGGFVFNGLRINNN
jgi:hypothetical protein